MSILIEDLHFTYFEEGKEILSGLTAAFSERDVTILTGKSGCGKSTLLYLTAGLYPRNAGILRSGRIEVEGAVFADGRETAEGPSPAERCALVGMLFQDPDLQFCMDTVRNEMIFCLENVCTPPEQFGERIREALAFCGLTDFADRRLSTLSGGEKQKVALACLCALQPKWLLLDEPFANIDDVSAREIRDRLQKLHEEKGVGILAVEHRLDRWEGFADRICILEDGRLQGPPLDGKDPDRERLDAAGILAPGETYPKAGLPERPKGETVLRLEDLGLTYPEETASGAGAFRRGRMQRKTVLEHVSAEFRRGSVYTIVGASGSGKSSLFGALSGLYPYTGSARLDGTELRKAPRSMAGRIGFVTQRPQDQFIGGTVRAEVQAAFRKQPDADTRGEEILRRIRLWRYRDISPYMLSQGQQRRLGVSALMAYDCEVLVCDEPTYAQDRDNTTAVLDALCRQAREKRIALIFSTHDRQAAAAYADEILELREGRLYAADRSLL